MSITEAGTTPIRIDPDELTLAIARATNDHVNAVAPDLPPIQWSFSRGRPERHLDGLVDTGYTGLTDPRTVAQRWAQRLGLEEQPGRYGIREFIGAMAGFDRVRVWYIADRMAFYRR